MPTIPGTIVAAPITTGHTENTFPIGDANEMLGGHHAVANVAARNAISPLRRVEGMTCWVVSEQKLYRLVGGIENTHWYDTAGSDQQFVFTQGTPADVWTIDHNLGGYPVCTVIDSANNVGIGQVSYPSANQIVLTFSGAFSGKAFLVL